MRAKDGPQVTFAPAEVKVQDGCVVLTGDVQLTSPMPRQDERLPHEVEKVVGKAGQQIKRQWFQQVMEKLDAELILERHPGKQGQGVVCRGTKPMTFRTIFETVSVGRRRIEHKADGSSEVPAAPAWNTPQQVTITEGLKHATCDAMLQQSACNSLSADRGASR